MTINRSDPVLNLGDFYKKLEEIYKQINSFETTFLMIIGSAEEDKRELLRIVQEGNKLIQNNVQFNRNYQSVVRDPAQLSLAFEALERVIEKYENGTDIRNIENAKNILQKELNGLINDINLSKARDDINQNDLSIAKEEPKVETPVEPTDKAKLDTSENKVINYNDLLNDKDVQGNFNYEKMLITLNKIQGRPSNIKDLRSDYITDKPINLDEQNKSEINQKIDQMKSKMNDISLLDLISNYKKKPSESLSDYVRLFNEISFQIAYSIKVSDQPKEMLEYWIEKSNAYRNDQDMNMSVIMRAALTNVDIGHRELKFFRATEPELMKKFDSELTELQSLQDLNSKKGREINEINNKNQKSLTIYFSDMDKFLENKEYNNTLQAGLTKIEKLLNPSNQYPMNDIEKLLNQKEDLDVEVKNYVTMIKINYPNEFENHLNKHGSINNSYINGIKNEYVVNELNKLFLSRDSKSFWERKNAGGIKKIQEILKNDKLNPSEKISEIKNELEKRLAQTDKVVRHKDFSLNRLMMFEKERSPIVQGIYNKLSTILNEEKLTITIDKLKIMNENITVDSRVIPKYQVQLDHEFNLSKILNPKLSNKLDNTTSVIETHFKKMITTYGIDADSAKEWMNKSLKEMGKQDMQIDKTGKLEKQDQINETSYRKKK